MVDPVGDRSHAFCVAALHSAPFGLLVATRVADGLHGLMDLTWGRVARPRTSTLLPPHRTAPRNASGTFLGASSDCTSAYRSTTPHCTIPVTTPHSTSLLHHYYKHTTATATNTHLPHLAMLMMPVMSSTPTCSDLLIHFPSLPLGDWFPATTRFNLDLDLDSDVDVDVDLGLGFGFAPALLAFFASCRGKQ